MLDRERGSPITDDCASFLVVWAGWIAMELMEDHVEKHIFPTPGSTKVIAGMIGMKD